MLYILRYIFLAFFTVAFLLLSFGGVSAHVLKADGQIGAVIHIDPEDDPIAGEPSYFFFEIRDKSGKFRSDHCDCQVLIFQVGKEIHSQPLYLDNPNPNLSDSSFSFVFPNRDIYTVKLIGLPTIPGAFQPFTLEYIVRVERESKNPYEIINTDTWKWTSEHIVHLSLGVGIIILGIIAIIKKRRETHKKR